MRLESNATYHEMWLFYADFKRFCGPRGKIFGRGWWSSGNVLSIIRANLSSIMRIEAMPVRHD